MSAQRVRIGGALADVRFPALCARCAEPPAGTLALTKMFRRVPSEGSTYYVFGEVRVPFCRDCVAAHERERRPADPRTLRALRIRWAVKSLPYALPIGIILYLMGEFASPALGGLASGDVQRALIFGAVVLFFALLLLMFVQMVRAAGRQLIADHTGDPNDQYVEILRGPFGATYVIPGPPTSTLAAVNFDDEDFALFEPDKRTFTFANPTVGAEFATVNASLVWRKNSPRARRAQRVRTVLLVVFAAIGLAFLVADLLGY